VTSKACITVIAAAGSTLASALGAALQIRHWDCAVATPGGESGADPAVRRPVVIVLEDDDGGLVNAWPGNAATSVVIGSGRSLGRLVEVARAGATVLNQDMPFLYLVRQLETALDDLLDHRASRNGDRRARMVARLMRLRAEQAALAALTPREREVLTDLASGRVAEQIAADSYRTLSTIRSQIKSGLGKLGLTSQVAAIALVNRAHPERCGWATDGFPQF
jgi:DNA-binding NarL/FixJ family response regulator